MVQLLSELANVLSGTIGEFSSFLATDGDIMQFRDIATSAISPDACRWLFEIKESFRQLQTLQQSISWLKDSCSEDLLVVSISQHFFCANRSNK
jgi:hypothetical protein